MNDATVSESSTPTTVSMRFKVQLAKPRVPKRSANAAPPSRVARMIALAHHIDDLVERGVVESYVQVARVLGVIDTRVTQICDLALLAPRIQEALLEGRVVISPRRAQKLVRVGLWEAQEKGFAVIGRCAKRGSDDCRAEDGADLVA